jgi:hypothetical protein
LGALWGCRVAFSKLEKGFGDVALALELALLVEGSMALAAVEAKLIVEWVGFGDSA